SNIVVSAAIMLVTIEQPNVMRVTEFWESPDPLIIMDYYEHGNIAEAGVAYDQYVTAIGQILDGLVHRDLKPENFLVEKCPFFKVVITDFGLSKAAIDPPVLKTFCGTLMYLAPEVFPGQSCGYNSSVDVWAAGVIFYEWLYDIPQPPRAPEPRNQNEEVWNDWIDTWCRALLKKLENEEDDAAVEILLHMLEVKPRKRWSADRCLDLGFENGLFCRRAADDLVMSASDPREATWQAEKEDKETKTPNVSPQQTQVGIDPEATIVLRNESAGEYRSRENTAS
ncbi:MAG: hypothetical protein M1835_001759, partial [Candelina submexicana]